MNDLITIDIQYRLEQWMTMEALRRIQIGPTIRLFYTIKWEIIIIIGVNAVLSEVSQGTYTHTDKHRSSYDG